MTDNLLHFSNEPLADQIRRSREEFNTLRFAHDYGFDATRYVLKLLGTPKLVQGVAEQCAEMRLNGTIVMDAEGNEHRNAKIDLAKLGLTAEQVAEVARLDAARTKETPANPKDRISETIQMRREGHDVGGEGHGAHAARVTANRASRSSSTQEI